MDDNAVTKIRVGKDLIGIIGLTKVLKEVTDDCKGRSGEEITQQLMTRLSTNNYLAPQARRPYEEARRFCMKKLEILGPGCAKCQKLAENTEIAARELGIEYQLEKVTDITKFSAYGILMTPALVVDGAVKLSGHVATPNKIKALLT
jgi:small redox-active disulfide protein 2